jgi:transcriptional regulator with XRE-family HTH domain
LKSVFTKEYEFLLEYLISARKAADITQQDLAERLKKPQSFVSKYERRERRLDVVEFVSIAQIIGFDPCKVVREIEQRLQPRPKGKGANK